MYTVFIILFVILAILAVLRILVVFSDKIKFFSTGMDSGFKMNEISLLWRLSKTCGLEEPNSLFWSVPALNRSITTIIETSKQNGTESEQKTQDFLAKLYKFRTKIELEPDNKHKMQSTKLLDNGQKLRIILKGQGVFYSSIVNNGRNMVISMPIQNGKITISGPEWIGRHISVYLWRKDDAGYVFDTFVTASNQFNGRNTLDLEQTENLIRTQKRRSVRCACSIYGQMYFLKSETQGYTDIETEPGYKCLIEDISEDGALIRIGGQGRSNIKMKIQFPISDKTIVMFGLIKAVEYNKEKNQSRLHLECIKIEPQDKNAILSFVYNLIPQNEKEIYDALQLSEQDQTETQTAAQTVNANVESKLNNTEIAQNEKKSD